ncbi:hypothetical protein [Janibacter sp. GS2]
MTAPSPGKEAIDGKGCLTKEENMRGSSLIWTIVGVLLIVALLSFIL